MTIVRLVEELAWYCPRCAERNTTELIPAELSESEREHLEEEYGIDFRDNREILLYVKPPRVTCCECSGEFDVEAGDTIQRPPKGFDDFGLDIPEDKC